MTPYNNNGPDFEFPVQAKLSYENELVGFVCEEGGLNFILKDGNQSNIDYPQNYPPPLFHSNQQMHHALGHQRKLVPERDVIHKVVLRGENDG